MSDDLDELLAQWQAFDRVTVECDRCHKGAPLGRVQPTPELELVCVRCLRELPYEEYERLRSMTA